MTKSTVPNQSTVPTKRDDFGLSFLVRAVFDLWIIAWALGIVTAVSVIGLLMVSGWFITMAGISGMLAAGIPSFNYFFPSGLIRTFALARTGGRYGDLWVSHRAIFSLLGRLRVDFFGRFARLSTHARAQIGSSSLQYRLIEDINILDEFVLRFVSPWVVGMTVLLVMTALVCYQIGYVGLLLLVIPIAAAVFVYRAKAHTKAHIQLQEQRQNQLVATLPALTQLTLWNRWHGVVEDIGKHDIRIQHVRIAQHQYNQWATWTVQAVIVVVLLWVLYTATTAQIPTSVAFLLAIVFGLFGLMEVLSALTADTAAYAKGVLAKERLQESLLDNTPKTYVSSPDCFEVALENVSVYQKDAVFGLSGVQATIRQGVPFVISGASGAGKSTLLSALAGEIAVQSGTICLKNTQNTIAWDTIDWQGQLGFLGQQVDIFDQSLADNLRLGNPLATEDELWAVLAQVGLAKWAQKQPMQLQTHLGEYGTLVSGGQARRIALARLLLLPKKVLLLDEPFAGLDDDTRAHLWQIIKTQQQNAILVVVSHHHLSGDYDHLVVGDEVGLL